MILFKDFHRIHDWGIGDVLYDKRKGKQRENCIMTVYHHENEEAILA